MLRVSRAAWAAQRGRYADQQRARQNARKRRRVCAPGGFGDGSLCAAQQPASIAGCPCWNAGSSLHGVCGHVHRPKFFTARCAPDVARPGCSLSTATECLSSMIDVRRSTFAPLVIAAALAVSMTAGGCDRQQPAMVATSLPANQPLSVPLPVSTGAPAASPAAIAPPSAIAPPVADPAAPPPVVEQAAAASADPAQAGSAPVDSTAADRALAASAPADASPADASPADASRTDSPRGDSPRADSPRADSASDNPVPAVSARAEPTRADRAPAGPAPFKIAFAYAGALTDGNRNAAHDRGRQLMETAFADQVITTVVDGLAADVSAEPALRELANQGNRVIFGATAGDAELYARLAAEFPAVKWAQAGGAEAGGKLLHYAIRSDEAAYLAGIVAGELTSTDTIGVVASMPVPSVVRLINAFTLGAQSVNPAARTKVAWVQKWLDPGRESEAAQSLINSGADVLLQSTDSPAPLQVAERAGKYAFGWAADMMAAAPKAHLGSLLFNWAPFYTDAVRQAIDGEWQPGVQTRGLREGAVDLANLAEVVTPAIRETVEQKKRAIADGSFRIWKGPLLTSEDKEILLRGEIADERFVREMRFFVKGVEGKLPAAGG
ncbi:MAG: BMP family ABC transporter substrate-binding protein [Lautropia sp.]